MSIRIMTKVWALNIPSSEKFVALALADNASDEGVCWPSIDTIAKKCSLSRRSVIDQVAKLREIGLIKTESRGHKKSLRFDFDVTVLNRLLKFSSGANSAPHDQAVTCNACTAEGGSEVQILHPEPSVEEEPSDKEPTGVPVGNSSKQQARRDPVVDQLVIESGGVLDQTTPRQFRKAGIAASEIRKVAPMVTAEEIRARAAAYRKKYHYAAVTPMAIAGHWGELSSAGSSLGSLEDIIAKAKACRGYPQHVANCHATDEEKAEYQRLVALYKQLKAQQNNQ